MNFQWAMCSFLLKLIKRCFRLWCSGFTDRFSIAKMMTDRCQNIEVTFSLKAIEQWMIKAMDHQSKTNLIFFFLSFRVLIPKCLQHLVLFPPRLNLWRFHIYPKFCPRALMGSVLLRKVGVTPKWITIRVVWKVWVRFPHILLARLFHRQVMFF